MWHWGRSSPRPHPSSPRRTSTHSCRCFPSLPHRSCTHSAPYNRRPRIRHKSRRRRSPGCSNRSSCSPLQRKCRSRRRYPHPHRSCRPRDPHSRRRGSCRHPSMPWTHSCTRPHRYSHRKHSCHHRCWHPARSCPPQDRCTPHTHSCRWAKWRTRHSCPPSDRCIRHTTCSHRSRRRRSHPDCSCTHLARDIRPLRRGCKCRRHRYRASSFRHSPRWPTQDSCMSHRRCWRTR